MIDLSLPGAKSKLLKMLEEDAYDIQESLIQIKNAKELGDAANLEGLLNKFNKRFQKFITKEGSGNIGFDLIYNALVNEKTEYGHPVIHRDLVEKYNLVADKINIKGYYYYHIVAAIQNRKLPDFNERFV